MPLPLRWTSIGVRTGIYKEPSQYQTHHRSIQPSLLNGGKHPFPPKSFQSSSLPHPVPILCLSHPSRGLSPLPPEILSVQPLPAAPSVCLSALRASPPPRLATAHAPPAPLLLHPHPPPASGPRPLLSVSLSSPISSPGTDTPLLLHALFSLSLALQTAPSEVGWEAGEKGRGEASCIPR